MIATNFYFLKEFCFRCFTVTKLKNSQKSNGKSLHGHSFLKALIKHQIDCEFNVLA